MIMKLRIRDLREDNDLIQKQVYVEQYGSGIVKSTQLKIAELGNDAGIVGAALLDD